MKNYYIRRNGNHLSEVTVTVEQDGHTHDHGYELTPELSQAVFNHSEGFEFGYGGSGPAQLALAILLDFCDVPEYAARHHQDFKWKFLSGLQHPGGVITGEDIEKWQAEQP